MTRLKINPLTRSHGYLSVEVEVEGGRVADAKSSGLLFRGFEKMLKGRAPHDAVYLTQRICGICSSAHAIAASVALENAFNIEVPPNGYLLRNLILGADILQNHLRHLCFLAIPDYITPPDMGPAEARRGGDYRLPAGEDERIRGHYLEALETSELAHKLVAVFGGKAPHLQSILAGGVTERVLTDRIVRFQSLLSQLYTFIADKLVPDVETIARYYDDYFQIGKGYGNLLSFGLFPTGSGRDKRVFKAGIIRDGRVGRFLPGLITREIGASWYRGDEGPLPPEQGESAPFTDRGGAYSWIMAPRYDGEPFEGGPLARMKLAGLYLGGTSVMDRLLARAVESKEIAGRMNDWLRELVPDRSAINWMERLPPAGGGASLIDSMRGALAHWVSIREGRITSYHIVTPSAWNLSPRDGSSRRGPLEEALIGTPVADESNPLEVGRVVRSYDPCVSCAVHVLERDGTPVLRFRL
jgi:hydrogenase large subunit